MKVDLTEVIGCGKEISLVHYFTPAPFQGWLSGKPLQGLRLYGAVGSERVWGKVVEEI